MEPIYTIKFTLPPILRPLFHDPLPPSDADITSEGPLKWYDGPDIALSVHCLLNGSPDEEGVGAVHFAAIQSLAGKGAEGQTEERKS